MIFKKLITKALVAAAIVSSVALVGAVKHASAACVPFDPNSSISTPVFNNFCNVPQGVGNEPDFVRIRQNMNGNNEDNQNNPVYTGGTLDSACNNNNAFDVWTYVHNDAASGFNNNGAGTSIAKDVMLHLTAPLGTTSDKFTFNSSVSASNAAGVQDSAILNCGNGNNVKLTLVPSTVHIYSQQYNWNNLADSSVNSTFNIGSPVLGSGTQFGCFEYRIVVVYTVKVTKVTPTPLPAVCTALTISQSNHTVTVKSVDFTANDAKVSEVRIDFGDGTVKTVKTTDLPISHTYTGNTSRKITATLLTDKGEVTSVNCAKTVSFTSTPVTPTTLPNTGAGSMIGIFTATSLVGAFLHRKWSLRNSQ